MLIAIRAAEREPTAIFAIVIWRRVPRCATSAGDDVRLHGNVAVAVGTTKQRGKDASGKEFSYVYRWTDTWVERNGKWQCVASQSIGQAG